MSRLETDRSAKEKALLAQIAEIEQQPWSESRDRVLDLLRKSLQSIQEEV